MEQNKELQYLLDDLTKKAESIKQGLSVENGSDEEYISNLYETLLDELNSAHSTILRIGREEMKLIKN